MQLPPPLSVLTRLGMDPAVVRRVEPRLRRTHCQAVVNWLLRYGALPGVTTNLEQVKGYLETFHHLCAIEEWDRAAGLISTPMGDEAVPLHYQLQRWGYTGRWWTGLVPS